MPAPVPRTIGLTLPPDELWALHHVLLERIEAELTAPDTATVDPPPLAVYQAFEALEAGETHLTSAQLEAVADVLRHDTDCPPWCFDCTRLEELRYAITRQLRDFGPTLDHITAGD